MVKIEMLKPGDVVRNLGSGDVYQVQEVFKTPPRVFVVRTVEVSNPTAWELVDSQPVNREFLG